jgi:hypothetical protein
VASFGGDDVEGVGRGGESLNDSWVGPLQVEVGGTKATQCSGVTLDASLHQWLMSTWLSVRIHQHLQSKGRSCCILPASPPTCICIQLSVRVFIHSFLRVSKHPTSSHSAARHE